LTDDTREIFFAGGLDYPNQPDRIDEIRFFVRWDLTSPARGASLLIAIFGQRVIVADAVVDDVLKVGQRTVHAFDRRLDLAGRRGLLGMFRELMNSASLFVMAGLDPAIHALCLRDKDVDARVKPGHDGLFHHLTSLNSPAPWR
jgi:hypothetical protein